VIIPPILICERRLGDPRVTFIPTQSIYERAPDVVEFIVTLATITLISLLLFEFDTGLFQNSKILTLALLASSHRVTITEFRQLFYCQFEKKCVA
jgi:hypothetical protein